MIQKKINFNIHCDDKFYSIIKLSIQQIEINGVIKSVKQNNLDYPEKNDFIIIGASDLESRLIDDAFEVLNNFDNRIVIITDSSDILFASSIAKLGFNNIFIIPQELQKFKTYLREFVEGLLWDDSYEELIDESKKNIDPFSNVIGTSEEMQQSLFIAKKVALNSSIDTLILGETGTGKGLLAKTIHNASDRKKHPFIDIICTAIPLTLLEAELFGYEKGAFTDAKKRKLGLFEVAENGTIFLDEIGDLSLEIQAKLLRAIDEKVIRRVGGVEDIKVTARIISATNRNLKDLVKSGEFREDLYHRLNVISIDVPPLRERNNDIIKIAEVFIADIASKYEKEILGIDESFKDFILNYQWPGNIRELRNSIERAVLLAENKYLKLEDLFNDFEVKIEKAKKVEKSQFSINYHVDNIDLFEIQKKLAEKVYSIMDCNKKRTAEKLGVSRPKLDRLLSKNW